MKDVMGLVRKLLAHAESALGLGNEYEANLFSEKAKSLLVANKITGFVDDYDSSASDLMGDMLISRSHIHPNSWGIGGPKQATIWLVTLADIIASRNGCASYYTPGSSQITLVGRASNRKNATDLITSHSVDLNGRSHIAHASRLRLSKLKTRSIWPQRPMPTYWRRSWLEGAVTGFSSVSVSVTDRCLMDAEAAAEWLNSSDIMVQGARGTRGAQDLLAFGEGYNEGKHLSMRVRRNFLRGGLPLNPQNHSILGG